MSAAFTYIRLGDDYEGHAAGQVVKVTTEQLEVAIDAGVVERYFAPGAVFESAPTLDKPVKPAAKKTAAAKAPADS